VNFWVAAQVDTFLTTIAILLPVQRNSSLRRSFSPDWIPSALDPISEANPMKPFAAAVAIATLFAMPQTAAAQTGTAPYCLQTTMGTRCMFSTMAECEAAKGKTTYFEQCLTRTDTQGTTGLGQRPQPIGPPSYDLPPPEPPQGR
jgi:hypothetical protein